MKKNCVICDAEFEASGNKKYCCLDCSKEAKRIKSRKYQATYSKKNKEVLRIKAREYRKRPEVKKRSATWRKKWAERNPHKIKEYNKKQYLSDPLRYRISNGINSSLKRKGGARKHNSTFKFVGYSKEELINHIESQFTDGMSWDRLNEIHIDHIRPISSFNYTTTECEDFKKCWALSNLQPLWAKDNMSKGAKWDEEAEA